MGKSKEIAELGNAVSVNGSNVGIGVASPSAPLDVVGSPGTLAEFRDGVASNFIIETSSNVTTIGNQAGSSKLAFKSSNNEAMLIDASGRVGIGTSSPVYKFEISDGARTAIINPNSFFDGIFIGTKESKPLLLGTNDTERMRIDSAGRVTKPYQPAFDASVWMGAYGSASISANSKVLFQARHNTGNAFSNSRFTAPTAGRYLFYYNLEVSSTSGSAGRFGSSFRKNGAYTRQAIFYYNAPANAFINLSNTIVLDLAVNDYVEVYTETVPSNAVIWSGNGYSSNDNGGFGGYLIG